MAAVRIRAELPPVSSLDDNGKNVYHDIAYPVTGQFWQELYNEIVKEFDAVMGQEEEK